MQAGSLFNAALGVTAAANGRDNSCLPDPLSPTPPGGVACLSGPAISIRPCQGLPAAECLTHILRLCRQTAIFTRSPEAAVVREIVLPSSITLRLPF